MRYSTTLLHPFANLTRQRRNITGGTRFRANQGIELAASFHGQETSRIVLLLPRDLHPGPHLFLDRIWIQATHFRLNRRGRKLVHHLRRPFHRAIGRISLTPSLRPHAGGLGRLQISILFLRLRHRRHRRHHPDNRVTHSLPRERTSIRPCPSQLTI
jgi:hypothetical protein